MRSSKYVVEIQKAIENFKEEHDYEVRGTLNHRIFCESENYA